MPTMSRADYEAALDDALGVLTPKLWTWRPGLEPSGGWCRSASPARPSWQALHFAWAAARCQIEWPLCGAGEAHRLGALAAAAQTGSTGVKDGSGGGWGTRRAAAVMARMVFSFPDLVLGRGGQRGEQRYSATGRSVRDDESWPRRMRRDVWSHRVALSH